MSVIDDILGGINEARVALTGGALAPSQTDAAGALPATGNGTGGAQAPDAVGEEDRLVRSLQQLVGRARAGAAASALRKAGQTGPAPGAGLRGAAKRWGGDVLGFGENQQGKDFATILRDNKLFHVYKDSRLNQKMTTGGIAEALGVDEPGEVEVVKRRRNGTGGALAPAGLAGGLSAIGGGTAPEIPSSVSGLPAFDPDEDPAAIGRTNDPLDRLRRLIARQPR